MSQSANGLDENHPGRLYELNWVTVKFRRFYKINENSMGDLVEESMFEGRPVRVILDVSDRVWVSGSYADELPTGAVQVGDGLTNGYDFHGERIISVPAEWCTFIDEETAYTIDMCMHEDEKLLMYAR
jgi:hypothetical protein